MSDLVVASYNAEDLSPTNELKDLVEHSVVKQLELVIGCDANAHYTVWGSPDVNKSGIDLLE